MRKIVLLSDGTGNSSAKVWRTNVWRVFESLDLTDAHQVAFYDDGVGTASFKPVAILGGAFGYGLKRNVIDIYKFACRNYRSENDQIFAFGFSRGAFTIRVVIGLILEQGLVKAESEAELDRKARAAYRAYRANNFHTKWPRYLRPENLGRFISRIIWPIKYSNADNWKNVRVRFLGLWDTVAAYGTPIEEMTRGISQWLWPLQLPNCDLDRTVQRACHALSIDDERTTFHPVLWNENHETPLVEGKDKKRRLSTERISQVWFPGVHSNVGGGYPDDSVAQISLTWILEEAKACGLSFKSAADANPQTFGHPQTVKDNDGRIYNPRQGLGGYYRYGPRDLRALGETLLSRGGKPGIPRIHESVFKRIQNRAHAYVPLGIPDQYEVVTNTGEVLSPAQNPYERGAQPKARWHGQEKVWNYVWWRRGVYFLTVFVSLYLFAFPLMKAIPAEVEYSNRLRWVADVIRFIERFLPAAVSPWANGYARQPFRLIIVLVVLILVLYWGQWLARKIQQQMELLWKGSLANQLSNGGLPTDGLYRFRTSRGYRKFHHAVKFAVAPALFALGTAWLTITLLSHVSFNILDDAGFVCHGTGTTRTIAKGEVLLANGITLKRSALMERYKNSEQIKNKNNLFQYPIQLPDFNPGELCQSMKILVDLHGTYRITLEDTTSFSDWNQTLKSPYGYYTTGNVQVPPILNTTNSPAYAALNRKVDDQNSNIPKLTWWQSVRAFFLVPLRRELAYPWFRVVVRVGETGGEESYLNPDFNEPFYKVNEEVKAKRYGELFLFVNDAVIGVPGLYDLFYKNNTGSTRVLIEQVGD